MNWINFRTHGESQEHAFEVMCNLIFADWCRTEFGNQIVEFRFINGSGGDGGVEAYAILKDNSVIGVQSKWFRTKIGASQINQIKKSFSTAIQVRPSLKKYVVCIPRDLGSARRSRKDSIAQDTEESRWQTFVDDCKSIAAGVDIVLWSETQLLEKLTNPNLQYVYKFWFERNESFKEQFELSFRKASEGWARTKYVPDVFAEGYIHETLDSYLGSYEITEKRFLVLTSVINSAKSLRRAYNDLLNLGIPRAEKSLEVKIQNDIVSIDAWLKYAHDIEHLVKEGELIQHLELLTLSCSLDDLKDSSLHFRNYSFIYDIEKAWESVDELSFILQRYFDVVHDNRLILLGDPGVGKTVGIVAEVSKWIANSTHLPILVNAKDFMRGDNWCSIITKTLSLSSNWTEGDLFKSLESYLLLKRNNNEKGYGLITKCVVCVDGIDESDCCFWRERVDEVKAYEETYPFLRFVFLSRPYVFDKWYELDYRRCFKVIPTNGDVSASEICDAYFRKYNIYVGNNQWIKQLLRNPLSVKLFCDVYQNTSLDQIDRNTTVITKLFKKKIDSLEERLENSHNLKLLSGSVKNILCNLAALFVNNESVTYCQIKSSIPEVYLKNLEIVLDFLSKEGFIYQYIDDPKDDFTASEPSFSWGMQPAFDYLIAQNTFKAIEEGRIIEISEESGIFQMLAIIVAEEKGKMLSDYPNIVIDEELSFELNCFMITNASPDTVKHFKDYIFKKMHSSVDMFREVVNKVIIPVCIIDNHPVGSHMLDAFLREFKNSASRDIWWSIPAYLLEGRKTDWYSRIALDYEYIELESDCKPFTKPLVMAWCLSSVNNEIRRTTRMKIIGWGLKNPLYFCELLEYIADINDEQILEDMFSIAYGIAFEQNLSNDFFKRICSWIMVNVFSGVGLVKYMNSQIRYFCSGIVKIAASRKIIESDLVKKTNPPFRATNIHLKIAPEALGAERMGGYLAIDYDLARYVLCDDLERFLQRDLRTREYNIETNELFEYYKNEYGLSDINEDGFIISLAYKYLIDQGWNEKQFWDYTKTEHFGIDLAIRRTYHFATHGAMSPVMTVAEKNVWIAKHRIEAFFADWLPYNSIYHDDNSFFINNYALIDDFINAFQEYSNTINRGQKEKWFNMDALAKLKSESFNSSQIEKWMKSESVPDFKKWLYNNGLILLSTISCHQNKYAGIEEVVWISSGAVKQKHFKKFIEHCSDYFDDRNELTNVDRFKTYFDVEASCTPIEASFIYPELETSKNICLDIDGQRIIAEKMVSSCLSKDGVEVEKNFIFPSGFTKNLMGISFGDGYRYFDCNNLVNAEYYVNRISSDTSQEILLANQNGLKTALREQKYKMFWVFRTYKSPSTKAYQLYPSILHDTDKSYIVWEENHKIMHKELIDLPYVSQSNNLNSNDSLMRTINEYLSKDE